MNEPTQTNTISASQNLSKNSAQTRYVNTHFVLAVTAIVLSCFSGFFTIPLALAALIFSLRTQDLLAQTRIEEAARNSYWAGLFGWLTVLIALLPILLLIFFGGALLAGVTAFLSAM